MAGEEGKKAEENNMLEQEEEVVAFFDEEGLGDAAGLLSLGETENDGDGDDDGDGGGGQEPKKKEAPKNNETNQINLLQTQITQLRQELSQEKKEEEPASAFTPEQLKQLMKDHANDPEVMYNIINHMTKEAAKKGTSEAVDSVEEVRKKAEHDTFVSQKYPALSDPSSGLREQVDSVKGGLGIGDHVQGDYMAISCLINEKLPDITKEAYEKGKADALKGKKDPEPKTTEEKKQPDKKKIGLTPTSTVQKGKEEASFTNGQEETIKKLKLNPKQQKLYASFMRKKG